MLFQRKQAADACPSPHTPPICLTPPALCNPPSPLVSNRPLPVFANSPLFLPFLLLHLTATLHFNNMGATSSVESLNEENKVALVAELIAKAKEIAVAQVRADSPPVRSQNGYGTVAPPPAVGGVGGV